MDLTHSQPPLRAAVIGTGKISDEHLKFLSVTPLARLVGVCDLSPSLAGYAARKFRAEKPYNDSAAMLAEAKPQVVHILTPPHTHARLVREALEAGAHVLCEKPIAPTRSEFLELWQLAQDRGLRLIEDHNYRFNEPVLAIERLVADGVLGAVRDVEVRMSLAIRKEGNRYADARLPHPSHNLPAGVLHEFITHLCYLTLRFLPDFSRVTAAWNNHSGNPLFKYDDLDALVLGTQAHARIRFSSHTSPDGFYITVRGTDAYVETDLFQPYLRVVKARPGGQQLSPLMNHLANGLSQAGSAIGGFGNKVMQKTPYEGLKTFLSLTYAALSRGGTPPVTFTDIDGASRLVDALLDPANRIATPDASHENGGAA